MIKKDFVMPILVLSLICLFVSTVLAVGNTVTGPVIEAAAAERALQRMMVILPEAEDFELVEREGLPAAITSVHRTTNNVGYIFVITTTGFGGQMRILCAIDPDGIIIRTMVLSNLETRSFSAPVFALFNDKSVGNDRSLAGIDAVSGSTITFTAYRNSILTAFEAFDMVRGEQF